LIILKPMIVSMLEALDYYGSDRARVDLTNKESEIKMAAADRQPRLNSAIDFLPYKRQDSLFDRKTSVNSRFGITGYTVREIGTDKVQ